jgi:2-dehydropantoate 2-reductase
MRYVVYGAGAVGGVIGASLHLAGLPVTLVARGDHLTRIREQGLVLDRQDGRHAVDAPAVSSVAEVEWTDDTVVLLCVKGHQTATAVGDLAATVPVDTVVVSAQNGVSNEPAVLRSFAAAYSSCVMLPATHLEPGVVVQKCFPTPGILDIGRVPEGTDSVAQAISADLREAGFESEPRPDIMAWKHRKLLMNLANGVDASCVPGDAATELIERSRVEAEGLLARFGIPSVSEADDVARRGEILRRRDDRPQAPGGSTWQSMTRGVDTEIDHLSGEIVLLGRLHGVPTPVNELVQRTTRELARAGGPARSVDAAGLLAQLDAGD